MVPSVVPSLFQSSFPSGEEFVWKRKKFSKTVKEVGSELAEICVFISFTKLGSNPALTPFRGTNKKSNKEKTKIDIDLIITSTTTTNKLMPGISNYIQKELNIKKCICLDILSGCAGFINAFEIACLYIQTKKIKRALRALFIL